MKGLQNHNLLQEIDLEENQVCNAYSVQYMKLYWQSIVYMFAVVFNCFFLFSSSTYSFIYMHVYHISTQWILFSVFFVCKILPLNWRKPENRKDRKMSCEQVIISHRGTRMEKSLTQIFKQQTWKLLAKIFKCSNRDN